VTTGSIKLDLTIPLLSEAEKTQLRSELGLSDSPILLGSSTWPGEESVLITVLKELRTAGFATRLLLVPRHAERRTELEAQLAADPSLTFHFRSRGPAPQLVDISVADTTGELRKLTQLADVVFVGKSLPPHTEGQTPVEAAALGKPVVFGPGMSNFRVIANDLRATKAARVAPDSATLATLVMTLFREPATRAAMSAAALQWHRANQGAGRRTAEIIRAALR
jgi:3-deoxy-D-manno-octulosonic-acid transferase